MSEETKTEESQEQKTTPDTNTGVQPETASFLDRADTTAKRLEEAYNKTAELLARQEELYARKLLAGKSEAGSKPISDDDKLEAEAKALVEKIY